MVSFTRERNAKYFLETLNDSVFWVTTITSSALIPSTRSPLPSQSNPPQRKRVSLQRHLHMKQWVETTLCWNVDTGQSADTLLDYLPSPASQNI